MRRSMLILTTTITMLIFHSGGAISQQNSDVTIELTIAGNMLIMPYEVHARGPINGELEFRAYKERTNRSQAASVEAKVERVHGSYNVNINPWRGESNVEFNIRWRTSSGSPCALTRAIVNVPELPTTAQLRGGSDKECMADVFIGKDLGDYIKTAPSNSDTRPPSNERDLREQF